MSSHGQSRDSFSIVIKYVSKKLKDIQSDINLLLIWNVLDAIFNGLGDGVVNLIKTDFIDTDTSRRDERLHTIKVCGTNGWLAANPC